MASFLFDFEVPARLIAQEPIEPRDQSRLLVVSRKLQTLAHHRFFDLPELLRPGDLLVLNDTRVLRARLVGRRAATGGQWQGLFLRADTDETWEILAQTRGRPRPGEIIAIEPEPLKLELLARLPEGRWRVRPSIAGPPARILEQAGRVPLPPYIRNGTARSEDQDRYQTVFARRAGAVAAPTAGLHFTPAVFEKLEMRGISWTFVTLHVGLGTFQPMQTSDPARHVMHHEWGEVSRDAARVIARRRAEGGRIVAVGTTCVRLLETVARTGPVLPWSGETDLFIHPPFSFRAVDVLITNFHLPRTTLLLLVGAFAGADLLEKAYRNALEQNYRFFSYGDAMLIE
jgi:S-adenosylmethionine:tRNA ribosyltransferase-isomerase